MDDNTTETNHTDETMDVAPDAKTEGGTVDKTDAEIAAEKPIPENLPVPGDQGVHTATTFATGTDPNAAGKPAVQPPVVNENGGRIMDQAEAQTLGYATPVSGTDVTGTSDGKVPPTARITAPATDPKIEAVDKTS